MLTPKGSFHIRPRHSNNILRDVHVGTSIHFRGQANEVVAESKANRLDPQIRQIGLREKVFTFHIFIFWKVNVEKIKMSEQKVTPAQLVWLLLIESSNAKVSGASEVPQSRGKLYF